MNEPTIYDKNMMENSFLCDASEKAIAAAAYMKTTDVSGQMSVVFIMGKSKLAPVGGHTIPRLELCAAVLAVEIAEILSVQMDLPCASMFFHTDSKVVLGYISNRTRRFFQYVANRVERILKISSASQWTFVPTDRNPADSATRCLTRVIDVMQHPWLLGPRWLCHSAPAHNPSIEFPLLDPEEDSEIKPEVTTMKTSLLASSFLGCQRFEKFSSWNSLGSAICTLKRLCQERSCGSDKATSIIDVRHAAELLIITETQREQFSKEVTRLKDGHYVLKDSPIASLSPFLDQDGILRVGGRINQLSETLPAKEINPIILPNAHHVTSLIARHHHEQVKHQGRLLTEGAIRCAGYWIVGVRRVIASLIHGCVTCRRLRGKSEEQQMANLPVDRLTPGPPFTSIGIDAFGPWQVLTLNTRGRGIQNKRWAIIFTCLTCRAVHFEIVEEMSSSSFINALRRFLSIRGPVKIIRSDRGTNFVGAVRELSIDSIRVEDGPVKNFLVESGIKWIFNPPHSSHMGGVWERLIGIARKILDSMLLDARRKPVTHETLSTLMSEVSAIMNSRPIAPISTDPESPLVLTPSMLLTGKVDFLPMEVPSFDLRDIYKAQWKHVQVLADIFWRKWRQEYLHCLQSRRKWQNPQGNLKPGDVVLMHVSSEHRNNWPLGIVEEVFPSSDDLVRKATVRVILDGKTVVYTRPVKELVLLLS